MADSGIKDINKQWESYYKPEILKYKKIPLPLVAEILGYKQEESVREILQSGMYNFAVAVKCRGGHYKYDIYPLRFIAWYEGRMS